MRACLGGPGGGFLFEGQLTVEREPPPPSWLVAQNALTALLRNVPTTDGAQAATDGAGGDEEMREEHEWGTEPYRLNLTRVEQELNLMGMEHEFGADDIARAIEATLQVSASTSDRASPMAVHVLVCIVGVSHARYRPALRITNLTLTGPNSHESHIAEIWNEEPPYAYMQHDVVGGRLFFFIFL